MENEELSDPNESIPILAGLNKIKRKVGWI